MFDIVVIPQYYYPTYGGLQHFTHRLCEELSKRGIEILIIHPVPEKGRETIDPQHEKNERVCEFPLPGSRRQFWQLLSPILQHHRLAKTIFFIGLEYQELIEEQLTCIENAFHNSYRTFLRIATSQDFLDAIAGRPERIKRFSLLKGVVVINHEIEKEISSNIENPPKITYIPNMIDETIYHPVNESEKKKYRNELGLPINKFLVLWTGRLEERKRVDNLLLAWHKSDVNGALVIAGIDSYPGRTFFKKLKHIIAKHQIKDVIFTGPYPEKIMPHVYGSADVFVYTSQREGFCNSVLEAAACGLTIVAYDIPGTREVVTSFPSLYHILLPLQENIEFSQALNSAYHRIVKGRSLKQQCERLLNNRLSPANIGDQYYQLLFVYSQRKALHPALKKVWLKKSGLQTDEEIQEYIHKMLKPYLSQPIFLGNGGEGFVYRDGDQVKKFIINRGAKKRGIIHTYNILKDMSLKLTSPLHLYPFTVDKLTDDILMIRYPYEESQPLTEKILRQRWHQTLKQQFIELLKEMIQTDYIFINLNIQNFRIIYNTLKFIDYGCDVYPVNEALTELGRMFFMKINNIYDLGK